MPARDVWSQQQVNEKEETLTTEYEDNTPAKMQGFIVLFFHDKIKDKKHVNEKKKGAGMRWTHTCP